MEAAVPPFPDDVEVLKVLLASALQKIDQIEANAGARGHPPPGLVPPPNLTTAKLRLEPHRPVRRRDPRCPHRPFRGLGRRDAHGLSRQRHGLSHESHACFAAGLHARHGLGSARRAAKGARSCLVARDGALPDST